MTDPADAFQRDLVDLAQRMVQESGDAEGFDAELWLNDWLTRPIPALGGRCPTEYMVTSEGREVIRGLLHQMQTGAYA